MNQGVGFKVVVDISIDIQWINEMIYERNYDN